jgi:hypothetical protein
MPFAAVPINAMTLRCAQLGSRLSRRPRGGYLINVLDQQADSNPDSNPLDDQSVHQDHHGRSSSASGSAI